MDKLMTQNGITLETIERPAELRGLELALAWALVALLAAGALLAAASLCRAARAKFAPAPAAETCLERNIRLGIYGDELCGFIPEGN